MILWLLVLFSSSYAMQDYSKHKIISVEPSSEESITRLKALYHQGLDGMTFVDDPEKHKDRVNVIVDIDAEKIVRDEFRDSGSRVRVLDSNLQELIDKTLPPVENETYKREVYAYDYTKYQPIEKINSELKRLANEYSKYASITDLGRTYENRSMLALKISEGDADKEIIFIQCGIHAREWISHATCMYIIKELLAKFQSKDQNSRLHIIPYEWIVLPVFNADGYAYTHNTDRLWRKTRSATRISYCFGADANRNWPFQFGGADSSPFPCSPTYKGTGPLSEIEVKNVVDYLQSVKSRLKAFFTFHSYGQFIFYPWSYTTEPSPDEKKLNDIANMTANALWRVNGTKYAVGPPSRLLYSVGGGSMDFVYGELGVTCAFCFELRGKSEIVNFLLPPEQIEETGKETFVAVTKAVALCSKL
ncbi:carboxypeptidase B-like isoform X1 [Rhopilema esculentum]|uniref:carboxypeptidase B-like isoform X1 n=1 Tax=Rhopilema esculentum TaxID=499914 RepID=UPI0031D25C20